MTMEECALRCHFHNDIVALRIDCLTEKMLDKKASGHTHLVQIFKRCAADFEPNRIRQSSFVTSFFENGIEYLNGRTFAFGTCNRNDFDMTRREAIPESCRK